MVSNIFHFPFFIWENPSHLLSYFSRWLKPPTRNPGVWDYLHITRLYTTTISHIYKYDIQYSGYMIKIVPGCIYLLWMCCLSIALPTRPSRRWTDDPNAVRSRSRCVTGLENRIEQRKRSDFHLFTIKIFY